ncbi:hypothetical protein [Pedobacter heparinus]|uniref:Uncharacterized protein n=1 Tax=Pedobacter heparinus (strain ATCC 13125 / DSM 2366 / CIP 104194 / JCM 7457 / NBRC 12017 / NCIMB 9290 / NRRL B-14731 / HIM 762-3) TaxID=485917 RepID=C6XVS2_PEDHD|nr:hypothetical protein [Pedobacter heparinus]ACU06147.1 hypothetical protein Phep_3956 [Pedobacter heparinus DSM 2366]
MLINNSKFKEEGYTADELQPNAHKQMERKCLVISQTVKDGDFTLEEALQLYGVSLQVYTKYAAQIMVSELNAKLGELNSKKEELLLKVKIMHEAHKILFSTVDDQMPEVTEHYKHLSSTIKRAKVKA